MSAANSNSRIRILSLAAIAFGALLGARLYYLEFLHGSEYSAKAESQYQKTVSGVFNRGAIYFQNKDNSLVSAATLKTGYTLAINPKVLADPEDAYEKISAIISINKEEFLGKAGKKEDPYEEILKRIETEKAEAIENLHIDGVGVYEDRWRFYPGQSLASNILGFVGYKDTTLIGRYGLEEYYNNTLSRDSDHVYVNFFAEVFSDLSDVFAATSTSREGDIVTSIEPTVQAALEKELVAVTKKYRSKYSGGIVIDPMTGEVVAMGLSPSYDPNMYNTVKDQFLFSNPNVGSVYEMGSIVKALTMAAGLDSGAVTARSTYDDKGSLTLNNKTVYNFDHVGRGRVDMQDVLDESLNTGAAYVALKMGTGNFARYIYNFGLASTTGIDLPNEVPGLMSNLSTSQEINFATASYGQGIAMSPIATVRALSALANGGTLITPHLVKEIDYQGIPAKRIVYPEGPRAIRKATSEEITRMLTEVVDNALLKGSMKMEHYSIAAKTGTALLTKPGGYYDNRFLHTFFGYFPSYNPRFLILLYTMDPQGQEYASHTLTEPFFGLTKFLINYYNVPPDR